MHTYVSADMEWLVAKHVVQRVVGYRCYYDFENENKG